MAGSFHGRPEVVVQWTTTSGTQLTIFLLSDYIPNTLSTEGLIREASQRRDEPGVGVGDVAPNPVAGTGEIPVFGRRGARRMASQAVRRAAPGLRLGVT
jgi:hypothetical protein